MLNIVLFGPPGAGKGTQSQNLIAKYQLVHLSTGDLLRAEISVGSLLGTEAKKLMDQGLLVPDEVVIGMISNKLESNKEAAGFIFDGFPRTIKQAEALDNLLRSKNSGISAMIELRVEITELKKRLLLRGKDSGRPDDANPVVISHRIDEYISKTAAVAGYYQEHLKYHQVNGIGSIENIFHSVCEVLKQITVQPQTNK